MDGGDPLHADTLTALPDPDLFGAFMESGDERAFRILYRRHEPALYATLLRLADGRREAAADLVQETWVTAIRRAGSYRGEAAFRTWLIGIGVNKAREARRARHRRRRRARRLADHGASGGAEAARSSPDTGLALDLRRALATLPERSREVLVLHVMRGHTHAEIARILGISEGTSKSQLHYARALLRGRLADYDPGSKGSEHDAIG